MIRPELDESLRADLASCSALLGILFLRKPEAADAQAVIGELRCASMREWPFGSESDLADVEIPKLYGNDTTLENLICIAPVLRK